MKKLNLKILNTTESSGVYLMKDSACNIIYVGKAKNIKKRISTYFNKTNKDIKTKFLVSKIKDFETIITKTEQEAFILESNLIKKHKPHYNIILKDDKRYLSLKIDLKEKYPRITFVRKTKERDGSIYFGPFASSSSVRETIKLIDKIFKIRKCKRKNFLKRTRPCINYQMGRCLAPCYFDISEKAYKDMTGEVILFLKGRRNELVAMIKEDIKKASLNKNYEFAALLRDKLFAVEKVIEKQSVVNTDFLNRDIIAVIKKNSYALVVVLFVRNGFLNGKKHFRFKDVIEDESKILESFIKQYYEASAGTIFLPNEIFVNKKLENVGFLEESIKVKILNPIRGSKKEILSIAEENAKKDLKSFIESDLENEQILINLKRILRLNKMPLKIECFDNSHTSGTMPVSGMVVFENGKKDKKSYRKYILKTEQIGDDYAYMIEVLERRYKKKENLPDILLLDGGKGQLSSAGLVLKKLGLENSFSVISIAKKDKQKKETKDKIYKIGRSNELKVDNATLMFLERIRDEAHRFVITFQRQKRGKKIIVSFLDKIEGIGRKRKEILIKHFGSIDKIKNASISNLCAVEGITKKIAERIKNKKIKK